MQNNKFFSKNNYGFTLTELMVAVAISGIVLAAVTQLFISSNKFYTVQSKVSNVQQDIRAAMSIMARDIRMAGYEAFGITDDPVIEIANGNNFQFRYNNAGGNPRYGYQYDNSSERLLYNFPDTGSYQGFTEQGSVDSMQFAYNTTDTTGWVGNPPDLDKIRQVRVGICGHISGSYSDTFNNTYCFNKTITCRNMGS